MTDKNELIVSKVFHHPITSVWAAWTTPGLIAKWFAPGVVMDVREMDVRAGGHFRFADPGDADSGEYTGTYLHVTPQKELSFGVMDYSQVSKGVTAAFRVLFEEFDYGSRLTLTSIPSENSYDKATFDAWSDCFDRLSKVLAES